MAGVSYFFSFPAPDSRMKHKSTVFSTSGKVKKKEWMHDASVLFFDLSGRLPDLGERHVGVQVLEPGFVATLHVCELGKEELLFCVS